MYETDFIDSLNQVVAQITIGSGGMLWTTPHFGITQWGAMSIKGYNEVFDLIESTESE